MRVREDIEKSLPIIQELVKRIEEIFNLTENCYQSEIDDYQSQVEKYFEFIQMKGKKLAGKEKLNLDNWLDALPYNHWSFDTNIMSVRNIKYLKLSDVYRQSKTNYYQFISNEYTVDNIFQKLFLLVVSLYSTATEIRITQNSIF
jgi:hypothetical protein